MDDLTEALENEEIDAIVSDTPVLEYWLHRNPDSKNRIVGGLFFPNKYAFAVNMAHGDLVSRISVEIIKLQEQGIIRNIRDKYFGNSGV